MFQEIEPFYGWLTYYSHEEDELSPYYGEEHNLFAFDRYIHTFCAHPLWDTIDSESLLIKILYANYDEGYAVIELLGEWNDLFLNDFKLLYERCLSFMVDNGVNKFIFIAENVFNVYLGPDDYYDAFQEEIEDGWMCLLRGRPHVYAEFVQYNISRYFYWSVELDDLLWRKLKPWQVYEVVCKSMQRFLPSAE